MATEEKVEVVRLQSKRLPLTSAAVPKLFELFKLKELPMAETEVEVELKGVPTAVVSALRRTLIDEMPGMSLTVPPDGFSFDQTTEVYMLPPFVNQRISLIRLRSIIPEDVVNNLRLELDVSNESGAAIPVYAADFRVVAGKLTEPIFNPTFCIATLQPGKRLVIKNVGITRGMGRDNAVYNVCCCGRNLPLDIPEYSDDEMRREGGIAVDLSGYKISSLVANPRHHVVKFSIPATAAAGEARAVLTDACANIIGRLRRVLSAIDTTTNDIQFTTAALGSGITRGELRIPGETATIGNLVARIIHEMENVSHVSFTGQLTINVEFGGDVKAIVVNALNRCIEIFTQIRRGIDSAR